MQKINTQTLQSGHKAVTYFSDEIINYNKEVAKQREIAVEKGIVDSQKHYRFGIADVLKIKNIIDDNKIQQWSADDLAKEILSNPEHREYLAEWFKGRGGFEAHFIAVLRMLKELAPEVGKLTGYTYLKDGPVWTLEKEL